MKITRIFDILENYKASNYDREDALVGFEKEKWVKYSSEQYVQLSNAFSLGLMSLNFKKGDKIVVISNNRPEWNIADMGMLQLGVVSIPLFSTIQNDELLYILKHAAPKYVIVSDQHFYSNVKNIITENSLNIETVYTFNEVHEAKNWKEIINLGQSANEELLKEFVVRKARILPSDLATIIYTSGTTGQPKGVMLSNHNIVINFLSTSSMHTNGKECRALSVLPFSHVYERMMNYHFQYKGFGLYYARSIDSIAEDIKYIKPHMTCVVPRLLEEFYNAIVAKGNSLPLLSRLIFFGALKLGYLYSHNNSFIYKILQKIADSLVYKKWREAFGGNIRLVVTGGSAVQLKLAKVFSAAGIHIIEGYGLTETSPVIAVNKPALKEVRIGTVGTIIDNIEVILAVDGEILCKGHCVMQGYHKQPYFTSEIIDKDGWFHTGDIGEFVEGKYLRIIDRKKDIFKLSNGAQIAPQPIENFLKESYFIQNAMVVGENQKHAAALIIPDYKTLLIWAEKQNIQYKSTIELVENTKVFEKYKQEVNKINRKLKIHEKIASFKIIADEWSIKTGILSHTLKLKRNVVFEKYKTDIQLLMNNLIDD